MSDPAYALHVGARTALLADTDLQSLMGGAPDVYDKVPADAAFPYIRLENHIIGSDHDLTDFYEVILLAHVWSKGNGTEEAWAINHRVHKILVAGLSLAGFSVKTYHFQTSRAQPDPDPELTHGIVQLRYEIEAA